MHITCCSVAIPRKKEFQKKEYRLCSIMVCILHHPYMMCILHIRMMPYITSGKDQSCHQSVPLPLRPLRVSHFFYFSGAGVEVIPKWKMGWMPTHGCANKTRTNSSRNIWLANLQPDKVTILWNLSVNTVWESNMFHSKESKISIKNFLPQSSSVQSQ